MAQLDILAEGPGLSLSLQDKQHHSDLFGETQPSISPSSFTSQSSEIQIRSAQVPFQESRYEWPSPNHNPDIRTPLATKNKQLQSGTGTKNANTKRKKRSHDESGDCFDLIEQKKMRKRKKLLSDDKNKTNKAMEDSHTTSTSELKSVAESLADDTSLGQLMENTFMEYDTRTKETQQNLSGISSTAASMIDRPRMREINNDRNADSSIKEYEFDFDAEAARIWNICATRVMAAVEKERSLRTKRRLRRRTGYRLENFPPKFIVWKD